MIPADSLLAFHAFRPSCVNNSCSIRVFMENMGSIRPLNLAVSHWPK